MLSSWILKFNSRKFPSKCFQMKCDVTREHQPLSKPVACSAHPLCRRWVGPRMSHWRTSYTRRCWGRSKAVGCPLKHQSKERQIPGGGRKPLINKASVSLNPLMIILGRNQLGGRRMLWRSAECHFGKIKIASKMLKQRQKLRFH